MNMPLPPRLRLLVLLPSLCLLLLGLLVAWIGKGYGLGRLAAMGAGFLPVVLGLLLGLLALGVLLGTWRQQASPPQAASAKVEPQPLPWRTLACVLAGILVWTLLVERIGFIPATVAQILISALALPGLRWRRVVPGSIVISLLTWLLFVGLLGLPVPAFGG